MKLALLDGDMLLHSCIWQTTNLTQFENNLQFTIEDWTMGAWCDDYVIALGPPSETNFRDDLFDKYKKSVTRSKGRKKRVDHLEESRELIRSLPEVVSGENIEADDLLGIWAGELGHDSVIVSADKDLIQIPGLHYNTHYMKETYSLVDEDSANSFFLEQMLTGDSIDNIPGIRGIGPKKAKAILEASENPAQTVLDKYKETYEGDWEDYFLINGKLLYILRNYDEWFTLDLFLEKFDEQKDNSHNKGKT